MTANECVCCGRPTPDGYTCMACGVEKPQRQLTEILDLLPAALLAFHRQTSRGDAKGSTRPGSTTPIDLAAGARVDAIRNSLTGWVRVIQEQRGIDYKPILGRSVSDRTVGQ